MPELPEAERATRLLQKYLKDGLITAVDTIEDNIVYSDISHEEFAKELTNRTVLNAHRYGKVFWLELDAPTEESRHPVFHLGMTGMIQLQGQEPVWYRVRPKDASAWPPRFMKFIIHVTPPSGPAVHVAFTDARRLGRIRLRSNPCAQPPIIDLGFDPLLSMPSLPTFSSLMLKRNMPIKALLLDQSFSAGVGNWVADEVLFHARIHPETRANELRPEEVKRVWEKVRWVCEVAVGVDSDGSRFPSDWLFRFRWGKGKKSTGKLLLPDGREGTIRWITVGGRTSAYVEEVQELAREQSEWSKGSEGQGLGMKPKNGKRKVKEPDVEEEKNAEEELVLQRKVAKQKPIERLVSSGRHQRKNTKSEVVVREGSYNEEEEELSVKRGATMLSCSKTVTSRKRRTVPERKAKSSDAEDGTGQSRTRSPRNGKGERREG